ncbi:MAG TPA: deoxyribonuclease IV [Elusimicrobiota bacterium]|nr:deoxyribonuclease IV [Elusimicrobiota bacterium]
MRIGVHCGVRDGLPSALEEAHRLGCETLQIFTHSPRQWRAPRINDAEAERFKNRRLELGLTPLVVHTPYLPNLCTLDEPTYARSYRALISDLEICRRIDADYFVIHPGSFSPGSDRRAGIARLTDALNRAIAYVPGRTRILIENMAGGGRRVGDRFDQIRDILDGIDHADRVGLCLDTCHTFASGYRFRSAEDVAHTLRIVEKVVGLERLRVIHANDSQAVQGSRLDLHEHIGKGHIGQEAFYALLHDPRLQHVAAILETPAEPASANRRNLTVMRRLRAAPQPPSLDVPVSIPS